MQYRIKMMVAVAAIGAAVLGASAANANPIVLSYSTDGGTTITPFPGGSSTTGGASVTNATVASGGATYSVSLSATGSPVLSPPDFFSNTITVSSSGAGTLILYATETGLTTPNLTFFSLGFTNNALSNTTVTEQFFVNNTLRASQLMPPNSSVNVSVAAGVLPANYSVTEVYSVTFGAGGGQVNATISEAGVVPEPMSLSILGASLAGLGLLRLRRRQS